MSRGEDQGRLGLKEPEGSGKLALGYSSNVMN